MRGRRILSLAEQGYPAAWVAGEIQRAMYERAGWTCEHCGCKFIPGTTLAKTAVNANGKPRILTVHHLDRNPANVDWRNLISVCQVCHLHIQAVWRPGGVLPAHWEQPPGWIAVRGLAYVLNGQLALPGF